MAAELLIMRNSAARLPSTRKANGTGMSNTKSKIDAAKAALLESLASMDFDKVDIGWIGDQITAFNKFVCDADEGNNGVEIRKVAA
jgi:hypothetical protein